ncbi:protochlorophyllide oxidoreductase [Chromatium okenii]|nr:protochlorophyllide oxidoreductase [Chromatium okenii]
MTQAQLPQDQSAYWDRLEAIFFAHLPECLERDEFTEYYSQQHNAHHCVRARSRIYHGEKLDRVMVHQYTLKAGRGGLVIFGYPRLEYAIPAFLLHIGGMPPSRTLLILDLAPISPELEMTPFQNTADQQRAALSLPATTVEWLSAVTSPHLLYCPLQPLVLEHFLLSFTAIVDTWRTYIDAAPRNDDPVAIQQRSAATLELKRVLLRNDPAFPVFTRAFGQKMSDVFAEAAFGGTPAVSIAEAVEPLPIPGSWVNKKLGVHWNADAQERVHEAPAFLRPIIRRIIEKEAVKEEINLVTVELVLRCEKKYRSGMEL